MDSHSLQPELAECADPRGLHCKGPGQLHDHQQLDVEFTRDTKTFMKDFIDACYDEYAEAIHTCLSGMSEEEKSLLDDGQASSEQGERSG